MFVSKGIGFKKPQKINTQSTEEFFRWVLFDILRTNQCAWKKVLQKLTKLNTTKSQQRDYNTGEGCCKSGLGRGLQVGVTTPASLDQLVAEARRGHDVAQEHAQQVELLHLLRCRLVLAANIQHLLHYSTNIIYYV